MLHPAMFRSEPLNEKTFSIRATRNTQRPPSNVPYFIDNLWEWTRPDNYPCRRLSAFASPTPELALQSGCGESVFAVEILEGIRIVQLHVQDAKFHKDIRQLRKLIFDKLGQGWIDGDMRKKEDASLLWTPCLKKDEVHAVLTGAFSKDFIDKLRASVSLWKEATFISPSDADLPHAEGEVFFEASSWKLTKI